VVKKNDGVVEAEVDEEESRILQAKKKLD